MRKFIFYFISFAFIGVIFLLVLIELVENDTNNWDRSDYMSEIIDKHKLVDNIQEPRMIFIGGSNLVFGIDSEQIQNELSLPVVNLSLHAGLGLEFILNELKSCVKSKDIVVLSIEYFLSIDGDYKLKMHTATLYPPALNYFNNNPYFGFVTSIKSIISDLRSRIRSVLFGPPARIPKKINISKNEFVGVEYTRAAFNRFGDIEAEEDTLSRLNGIENFSGEYNSGISLLNDFNAYAKANGICVYFLYPNYPISEFNKNKNSIELLHNSFIRSLEIEVIGSPLDFVYPDSLFLDTVYHLDRNGRKLRTRKIIELLQNSAANQCIIERRKSVIQ